MNQFIHLQTYSRTSSPKKQQRSARNVILEAIRDENNIRHLEAYKKPLYVYNPYNEDLLQMVDKLYELADKAKDKSGRKLKQNASILISGVASYPLKFEEVMKSKEEILKYKEWRKLTVQFLKSEFGNNLKMVIQHTDEPYPHLHFYAHEGLVNGNLSLDNIHPGRKEQKSVKSRSARLKRYSAGLKKFQEAFYSAVSIIVNHNYKSEKPREGKRINQIDYRSKKRLEEIAKLDSIREAVKPHIEDIKKIILKSRGEHKPESPNGL